MRLLLAVVCLAQTGLAETPAKLEALVERGLAAGGRRSAIGVTRRDVPIPSLLGEGSLDYRSPKKQILLIGGVDGSDATVEQVMQCWEWFHGPEAAEVRERFALAAVPVANPHAWLEGSGPELTFPPEGVFYASEDNVEAQYLWRWIGMHAPDLVLIAADELGPSRLALALRPKAAVGGLLAVRESLEGANAASSFRTFLAQPFELSPARREIQSRLARTPREVATQLAAVYGHELPNVVYIPAVALIGRLRLGELTGDRSHLADVERIVKPYLDGAPTLGEQPTSSHLPGHLVFGELARLTGNRAYAAIAKRAAELGFGADGAMLESMPLHSEMSDAVFMGCAILAQTGNLSGDPRYFRMALRHLRFMEALDLRPDGLYRHSPLDEAAWGRGNGFPALGLSWSLLEMPENAPGRAHFLASYRGLMTALTAQQDPTGMWREVIDHEESYRELSATSMIGFALAAGLRQGWIEGAEHERVLEAAWAAVKARVAADGSLVDVCRSTGKQPNLRAYLDREAILGRDDRGGAMALLFAVEMARRAGSN